MFKQTKPLYKFETCVKYKLLLLHHMHTLTKLHRNEGLCTVGLCGEVRGWIRHCKSGTDYTPAATGSLREFRIGSCEKSSSSRTPKTELFQEDLVVMPPQVEQMGELANQRSFFSVILKCRQTLQESQNQLRSQ